MQYMPIYIRYNNINNNNNMQYIYIALMVSKFILDLLMISTVVSFGSLLFLTWNLRSNSYIFKQNVIYLH